MSIIICRPTLDFMGLVLLWPGARDELKTPKLFFVKFALLCIFTLVNLTSSILHLTMLYLPENSLFHVAEDLITIVAQIGCYYFIIAYVAQQRRAADIYARPSDFTKYGKPPKFDFHSAKLLTLSKLYRFSLHAVVASYFLEPMLSQGLCEKRNFHHGFEDVCGLVINAWMPFNIRDFPYKQAFYLWQIYSIFWLYEGSASVSFLIMGTSEHLLVRIWHLKGLLQIAINGGDKTKVKSCIDYHNDIFALARAIDDTYINCLFAHVLFTGALFGIMGFSIVTVGISIKTMTLFVAWFGAVIFASFGAQRLPDESVLVAEEVYGCKWFDLDFRFQKTLLLIMKRALHPITLHAGVFAELSNTFIVAVSKTAYSYLTLLTASSQ